MDQQFEGTLIHAKGRVSSVVAMFIAELSLPIKIEVLEKIEMTREPEHLKLNLNGRVPVYFEGSRENPTFVLVESAAIAMYLLEKYDKEHKLLPKVGDLHKRAKTFQFFSFASCELYPFIAKSWEIMYRPGQTPERMGAELAELGKKWKNEYEPFLIKEIGDKKYLLGDDFSAADLIMSYTIGMLAFGILDAKSPVLYAYYQRLAQRPAFKSIFDNMGPKKE
eukprot:TRINITY_DN5862_c0_g1_i1.p1 TRINITY_DN5862_c0_g1~~TRINITY_DN5862_c0_g1_i1.p1  ORF type:complete len:222 (+),score=61.53 TRINITY_DN5862_c0_g1_i1:119-784(+)